MNKTIGIIGFGTMGSAIAAKIKQQYQVYVYDKEKDKTRNLSGITVADNILNLVTQAETIISAVKPQDFDIVLNEIKDFVKGKLIISIAAGMTTAYIERHLGAVRVTRVMPNLPARIGKGMICLCQGESATKEDLEFTQELFGSLGRTLVLNEDLMDAATAISGSGPGYLYDWAEGKDIEEIKKYTKDVFIPSLAESAKAIGFSQEQANLLAGATGEGSVVFLEKEKITPQEAKNQVVSRGGTTEAGLKVLHEGGSLSEAVKAALRRAKELSRG